MPVRYTPATLIEFATALQVKAGVEADKARVVAEILVEGDLMGHTTHGLMLLPQYLAEAEKGGLTKTGQERVIADFPAAVSWDGNRLPGPWLTVRGLALAAERAKKNGTCTLMIRRSHHIACLAAYLRPIAEQGLMVILSCSDPSMSSVAPHGGRRKVYTPNPFAAAWPTAGYPVILDVSMSITTNGMISRCRNEKRPMPGKWLLDADGNPTDDPNVLFNEPPGTLLPMGGVDHGHKGYAFALLVEALTGGLAGFGRAEPGEGWGATIFIQVFDPAFFGGRKDFTRQTEFVADACRENPPRPGFERVRLPGESGLRRREKQLVTGIELYAAILPNLEPWGKKFSVPMPAGS